MKLPLIVFGLIFCAILFVRWYKKRASKEEKPETKVKTEKKICWGWIVCVLILILAGYYGYKYYLAGTKIAMETVVAQNWQLCWDKTPEAVGFIPCARTKTSNVKIEKMGDIIVFRQFYEHNGVAQTALFIGQKTAHCVYRGHWQQSAPAGGGNFLIRFTPDMKAASGWQDNGTKRAIPMQMFAK